MGNFLINLLNSIISGFGSALSWVLNLLPTSPFQAVSNADVSQFLSGLAWIIPFPQIIAELELWITAVAAYYLIMVVLRWVKAIG